MSESVDTAGRSPLPGVTPGTWVIDPGHSSVGFSVRHLMSRVRGRFTEFSGEIVVGETADVSSVHVAIELSSVDTANEMRDNHLRTKDFFDIEQSPKMTFASTALRAAGDKWTLTGDLTIRDITKAVDIEVEFLGVDPTGMQGEPRVGFAGKTSLSRSDFGIDFGVAAEGAKVFAGDQVEIVLEVEATFSE
ncbi:YceI family protein [Amycolatopsis mongoliensis]|uniref:YceI family protein n=1 Tax=Amycolatopsis mongoliensis TaxID=715475 RepID=A0A9Y2NDZ4_9PSEU|nr:YceI family protein [Amycolatopsis sp. 4-36]WIY02221.1 YceI family protein [Amycolatopsis sp. 4-36]